VLLLFGPLGGQEGGPPLDPGPIIPAELFPLLGALVPKLVEEPSELKSSASSSPLVPVAELGSYWLFSEECFNIKFNE